MSPDPSVRDAVLLRVFGSPDAYGKHIDGLGGATSSTSKVALISKSSRADCDVDYYYGAVSIDKPAIDWSENCANLTSAVGRLAIRIPCFAALARTASLHFDRVSRPFHASGALRRT